MRRPLVGITTYHREEGDRPRFSLPSAYVEAVRVGGGTPVLLPPGEDTPAHLLEGVDALLFSGGGDLHPENFGGDAHDALYFMCPERDAFEIELMGEAIEQGLPTLAICRGAQVLNVARGGDVHAHLPDVVGDEVAHRESQDQPTRHGVRIEADSQLARVLGTTELPAIASWHHQAVRSLGDGLRPVAWAPDGTVEALELEGAPALLAVQWHPELQLEAGSLQRRLFAALAQAGRSRPAGRR